MEKWLVWVSRHPFAIAAVMGGLIGLLSVADEVRWHAAEMAREASEALGG